MNNLVNAFKLIFSTSYDKYYHKQVIKQFFLTIDMTLISGIFSLVLGLFFGILLTLFKKGGLKENKIAYTILSVIINILRSIPFIILIVLIIPLTRAIVGTSIGLKGSIIPLIFGTVPFYARQVEAALCDVEYGKIEAARACGSSTFGIIFRVYLHEAVPSIIRVTTITAVSLVGLTATAAGAVAAGGLGDLAINTGLAQNRYDIIYASVLLILLIVSIIQLIGTLLAKATTNKHIITFKKNKKEV